MKSSKMILAASIMAAALSALPARAADEPFPAHHRER